MNYDAICSFVGSVLTAIVGSGFIHLPAEAASIFHDLSVTLAMLGTALHLDNK